MESYKLLFWILLSIVFYTYIGYGIILFMLVKLKRLFYKKVSNGTSFNDLIELPEVTLLIPAYNEKDYVLDKIENTNQLNYPKDKLKVVWVTDGSDDGTNEIVKAHENITLFHKDERKGKIDAMNRVMKFVKTPIVVFTDANTKLGKDSVMDIVACFNRKAVGCVSGEKRIVNKNKDNAAGSGEGLYWKYESQLKSWDSELYSAVGAAGELFAIRTELYKKVEPDTILDDFIISLRIAMNGYVIEYVPSAYAVETASKNVKEELKRKIRISAGGIQSVKRLWPLLNVFKYGVLSFQYISHRVLRWTITPVSLLLLIPVSLILALSYGLLSSNFFTLFFWIQIFMYVLAFFGWYMEQKVTRIKILFVPYYFLIMNLSVILGFFRYMGNNQSVKWERAQRAS